MKKVYVIMLLAVLYSSCGQIDQMKALEKCKYQILSADSIYLANTDVSRLIRNNRFSLESAPGIAFALLQQKLLLKARINLKIDNPGKKMAGINAFEYKVFLKNQELTTGYFDQQVTIEPNGGSTVVPIKINQDIYPLLANSENRRLLTDFLTSKEERKTIITLKIKPSLGIGNEKINYPGFISLDKEISNKMLLSLLK